MVALSPYIFVLVYLIVDIAYIIISKPVYNSAVKKISGKNIPTEKYGFVLAAIVSYASMAIAWLFLVVPTVHYMISKGTHKILAGIIAGSVYGIALYGVFNGTLYAMFNDWDITIAIGDMIWGVSWATIITTIFAITLK